MDRSIYLKTKAQAGFTLIELMVVIVILGILAVAILPNIMNAPVEAKQTQTKMSIQTIETALKMFRLHNGYYPTTDQGLRALVEKPDTGQEAKNWQKGGYLDKGKLPKDPWGNEFIYICPGIHDEFDIISYGLDGVSGGEDENKDINSWEIE